MEELVVRLNKIFFGQFGCQFSFEADSELVAQEWGAEALMNARTGTNQPSEPLISEDGRIGFVIRTMGRFAGLAIISKFEGKKSRKFLDMAEFAVALIEDQLATREKPLILRRAEENQILQGEQKNVIPLRPANIVSLTQFYPELPEQKSGLTSTLILAKDGFPFQRLGLDVHVRTGRVAFLSIDDLPSDTLSSHDAIRDLGEVTIFIEDITKITLAQQEFLAAYLRTTPGEDTPVFLICAKSSIEDLISNGQMLAELSRLVVAVRIPWNPQDMDSAAVKKAVRIVLDQAEPAPKADTHFVPFHVQYLDEDQPTFH